MGIDARERHLCGEEQGTAGNCLRCRTIRGKGTYKRVSADRKWCAIEFQQEIKGG
jgi:hypothetical protein